MRSWCWCGRCANPDALARKLKIIEQKCQLNLCSNTVFAKCTQTHTTGRLICDESHSSTGSSKMPPFIITNLFLRSNRSVPPASLLSGQHFWRHYTFLMLKCSDIKSSVPSYALATLFVMNAIHTVRPLVIALCLPQAEYLLGWMVHTVKRKSTEEAIYIQQQGCQTTPV